MKCKSRELRAGILYTTCGCCRRNGLQYDCPRSECQGRKICLVKPFPKCCPSQYGNRFANVIMGKSTNPIGARSIRVFNDGGESPEILYDSPELLHSFFHFLSLCNSIWSLRWTESLQGFKYVRPEDHQMWIVKVAEYSTTVSSNIFTTCTQPSFIRNHKIQFLVKCEHQFTATYSATRELCSNHTTHSIRMCQVIVM